VTTIIPCVTDFLIRTQEIHGWPAVHRDRMTQVLVPDGFECDVVEGWGDLRLRCGRVDVSFSGEEAGWLVSVEGELEDADGFLTKVTRQVAQAVGEPCEWISLG
jgi:hypothetical protein